MPHPDRRSLLLTSLAGALGAARLPAQATPAAPPGPPGTAAFWAARFKTPAGEPLDLAPFRGRYLLVNFWATWCPPCVKEMPVLDAFAQAQQAAGWTVLGLAVDGPTPVREFLARRPVSFPIGLAGLNGSDLARSLGNLQGGLPFTVLLNPAGEVVWRRPGATDRAQLDRIAREFVSPNKKP